MSTSRNKGIDKRKNAISLALSREKRLEKDCDLCKRSAGMVQFCESQSQSIRPSEDLPPMAVRRPARWPLAFLVLLASFIGSHGTAAPPSTAPVEGLRQNTPAIFALTNLRIIPEPG